MSRPASHASHPVLVCAIQGASVFKLDGEGSGRVTLTFDSTQADVAVELFKHYREAELLVTFVKLGGPS